MNKIYIGIDNGVSGSIAIIKEDSLFFSKTPTISQQDYTKKKQNITRLDCKEFYKIFKENLTLQNSIAIVERPMVNPTRFKATKSALRCLEATLICLETLKIPYMFIDSKQWQKELLPQGLKREELKKASLDIGIRLFPLLKEKIVKQKDADSLLIAEFARRKNL